MAPRSPDIPPFQPVSEQRSKRKNEVRKSVSVIKDASQAQQHEHCREQEAGSSEQAVILTAVKVVLQAVDAIEAKVDTCNDVSSESMSDQIEQDIKTKHYSNGEKSKPPGM